MSIDEEVERCRQKLCHSPCGTLERLLMVIELSCALFNRYQQVEGIEYLEESITYNLQGINDINLSPI